MPTRKIDPHYKMLRCFERSGDVTSSSLLCVAFMNACASLGSRLFVQLQVQEKLSEIARVKQGEPDASQIAAAKDAQNHRNKKVR